MSTACPMCSMSRSAPHHHAVRSASWAEEEDVSGLAWMPSRVGPCRPHCFTSQRLRRELRGQDAIALFDGHPVA